ncbi:MAG: TIGR00266 family protein [Geminicoccaceae bacterium]
MSRWYFAVDGQRVGPLDDVAAADFVRTHGQGLCWRPGFEDWMPIADVPDLQVADERPPPLSDAQKDTVSAAALPKAARPWGGSVPGVAAKRADEIDFEIRGAEMQFVEIELDPGESAVAEAGAMMFKAPTIEMNTVFGDGSEAKSGGFMDRLVGAGKRLLTGESLFTTVFTHTGQGKARVAFAAPYPGNILAISLAEMGGSLICQKDSFLAAAKGVSIGIHFQKRIMTGLFGGEGFIMQKLEGEGWVFVHMGGTLVERELAAGEVLHVDTGCLAAMTASVDMDVVSAGGIKSMLFGGEGLFFATLQGPGKVWLQSLPFSRLAGRMLAAATFRQQGEGSVLGGMFQGDR